MFSVAALCISTTRTHRAVVFLRTYVRIIHALNLYVRTYLRIVQQANLYVRIVPVLMYVFVRTYAVCGLVKLQEPHVRTYLQRTLCMTRHFCVFGCYEVYVRT